MGFFLYLLFNPIAEIFDSMERNQAVHSKTGPETGRYVKVTEKLKRYNIVPFHFHVNRSGTMLYSFPDLLVFMGDTKPVSMTTSDVKVEVRPNCTSLMLPIVWSFQNRPFDLHHLFISILIN